MVMLLLVNKILKVGSAFLSTLTAMVISALLPAALLITIPQAVEAELRTTFPHDCRVHSRALSIDFYCNQIDIDDEADQIMFKFTNDFGNALNISGTDISGNKLYINQVGFIADGEIDYMPADGECIRTRSKMFCELYLEGQQIRIDVHY